MCIQELYSRAQGEVSIREALRELELWGAGAVFSLTPYTDSKSTDVNIIKDWKDLVNQVICAYKLHMKRNMQLGLQESIIEQKITLSYIS